MKLPNDLIKSTDYSKAKEREIHMFEYVNGKHIQYYTLDGKHEMTPQEIVNCLNAIATLDCDLATAYVVVKCQNEKIADLQHKLEVAEKALDKMSNYAINDNDLYDLVSDFNIENERYGEDHFGIDTCDVVDYFKEQAESELKGE